ncbi:hypothetical protein ABKV19_027155, partial [Rosa sericea]
PPSPCAPPLSTATSTTMWQGNILVWNCRGITNTETQRALIDMVQAKRPQLIFLSETLAQQTLIDSLTNRLGFAGNVCITKQPGCQGLALLWSHHLNVDVRTSSFHHIDAIVSEIGHVESWRFTGIYGFPARGVRSQTWNLIAQLAGENCGLPWLMVGDFNEVWCRADKSGGPSKAAATMNVFQQTMMNAGLLEMGFYEEQRRLHLKQSQLLALQETYWRQRSRALWLKDGDRNSTYFHRAASQRRNKNRIKGLQTPNGTWETNPTALRQLLADYYNQVFRSDTIDDEAISEVFRATPLKVTAAMNDDLALPYSDDEIKAALNVCLAIRNFLEKGESWQESNFTHICLIPKIQNPTEAAHFRPIALCNVIYRICSKVLANRLKKWLPDIVSPLQSAYVPGRLISNNTLVATEVAHFMYKLRSQEEVFFSLKLDISKAYDRLEWAYLQAILTKLGFAPRWVSMVMSCMTSVSYAILENGETSPT